VGNVKDEVGAAANYRLDYDRARREHLVRIQLPNCPEQNWR
jgi:hypothetical protein